MSILFRKRAFTYFDGISFGLTLAIALIGLLFVYSATYQQQQPFSMFFKKQLLGIITGIGIYLGIYLCDHRQLVRLGYFGYFGMVALLVVTLVKGKFAMGAGRWIDLKIVRFQPSELAKLLLSPFITYYLETEESKTYSFPTFLPILALLGASFLLIIKQPDLGTGLIVLGAGSAILWFAGIGKKFFIITCLTGLICAPILYHCLHPYQRKRIEVFLGGGDSKKERYHLEQSKIAIGSGGITGKGILQGTQTRLHFLPESRTDFIFSVLCEEWGILGAICLILLYCALVLRNIYLIYTVDHFFDQLLAIGLLTPIALSIIINIGMVTNLLPIVGIPLPLMSYGISHLWITFAILGWLNAIVSRSRIYT